MPDDNLLHYIDGKKVTATAAEKALAKAEKDGKPVRYDTVIADSSANEADRVLAAVNALGDATPTQVAERLNGAIDLYASLTEITTAAAKDHLTALTEQGELEKAGSRFKVSAT